MAWRRRMGGTAGPLSASGEASNGDPVQIEMYINGSWVDITSYVMVRDNSGNISVARGRRDEGSATEQSTCQMTLDNRDGRWSPRNPTGAYYGLIGRNQPIRVSVPNGLGGKSYRFQGEVSLWPQMWDPTGTDVYTEIEASGILRRLSQGPAPSHSVLYDALTGSFRSTLLAYWPMEDAAESSKLSTPLTNGSAMTYTGTPDLASFDGFTASDPVPSLTGSAFTGNVTKFDTSSMTGYQMRFLLNVPAAGFSNLDAIARMHVLEVAAGASLLNYYDIFYNDPPGGLGSFGGPGTLTVQARDGDQADIGASASIALDVRGRRLWVSLEIAISGTTITPTLRVLDIDSGVTDSAASSLVSTSLSRVVYMSLAPSTLADSSAGVTGASAGHLILQNSITSITDLGRHLQPNGETAGRRVERLCGENGIPFESIGDLDSSTQLGNQSRLNPLDLMQEAELADTGMLYESMPMLGLGYRTRLALGNQDPQLTLSYSGFNLAEIPTPVEDDRYIQNQVTVTVSDISQTYSLSDGSVLSTSLPPAGVGVYGTDLSLNLKDTQTATLRDQAAWRVHLGTVDEPRYPHISVNLAHSSFTSNPALKQAVLGLRQGDRVLVQNPPSWLPPGDIDQIILGFEETITHFEHRVTFICAPASPYNNLGILDATDARIDTDGSEVLSAITSSATTMMVIPSTFGGSLWTTANADAPWNIRVGGEVMTVTANTSSVYDSFTRTESNGWGTANSGQTWTVVGTAADYAVGSGIGTATLPATGIAHITTITSPSANTDVYVYVGTSVLATGASLLAGPVVRYIDNNNHYMARIEFTTSNTLILTLRKRVGGTETSLASYAPTDITHVAGTLYALRFQVNGSSLKARVWDTGASIEPPHWHVEATDTALVLASSLGTRCFSNTGNTNVNPVVQYDGYDLHNVQTFTVTRSVNAIVKAQVAGEDVRLATPTIISL
jgi:hypothetical protein